MERLDERRPHHLDESHPHAAQRLSFVRSLPAEPPQVTLTLARAKEIDLELSRWLKAAEATVRERLL